MFTIVAIVQEGAMQSEGRPARDVEVLVKLNREYIRAVQASDVGWFEATLADDFLCSLPDGSLIDRQRFLDRAARPLDIENLDVQDVEVRLFGDVAIIHARTTFLSGGAPAAGRYTDVWWKSEGRWKAVAAHFTRSVQ